MVKIENVSYHYDEEGKHGINELNLHIRRGECVLLCGESGCGKTTVTRLVNGLIPHFYEGVFAGKVTVCGKDAVSLKPDDLAQYVGSVFQNPRSQFFNLDTTSEIAFGCENIGLPPQEIRGRVARTSEALKINHLLDKDIFALSGGEKQLIAMASAYALGPEIFVLDEPSSNLDAEASRRLADLLETLKKMGKTIIIAEHRLYYLTNLIDRVIYMRKGRIVSDWAAKDFLGLPPGERAGLGLRAITLDELKPSAPPIPSNAERLPVTVNDLSASYGRRERAILKNISFSAAPGEVIGVIGRNGQGKSTLARVLCGLHRESGGRVWLGGKPLQASHRCGLFYLVMQDSNYQLFTESVESELRLSKNKKSRPTDEKIERIMDALSLSAYRERHPMSLSGGQKQRCAIGVSLAHEASVLIFDEPTSGLDFENMQRVVGVIRDLRRRGKTIFIVTHDYELLLAACTRVIELRAGEIARDCAIDETTIGEIKPVFI